MNQMSLTFPLPCHSPWPNSESLKYILAAALSLCPGGLDIYASDLTVWLSLHILCIVLSNDLQDYISDRHLSPILIINPFALFAYSQSFQAISKNSFHHLLEEGLCHSVWVNVSEMPQFHSEHSGHSESLRLQNTKGFWWTSCEWITSKKWVTSWLEKKTFACILSNEFKGNNLLFIGT